MSDERGAVLLGVFTTGIMCAFGFLVIGAATKFEDRRALVATILLCGLWWFWFPPLKWLLTRGLLRWIFNGATRWWMFWESL